MLKAKSLVSIFDKCIDDYHKLDDVNQEIINPFEKNSFEGILYRKCWIDTVQWHYEDIIRDDEIKPKKALDLKRKIDKSNQKRTNLVEVIDDYFIDEFKKVNPQKNATINTRITFPKEFVLIFGNESNGISKSVSNFLSYKITIPKVSKSEVDSLNITSATAIIMNEISNQSFKS